MPYGIEKPRSDYDVFTSQDDLPTVLNRLFNPERHDLDMLTQTAIGEGRGEGKEGMAAIMRVILNRQASSPGSSIEDVVLAPKQFSMYNEGDPNLAAAEEYPKRDMVEALAAEIMRSKSDPTGGATHYYNPAKANPDWAGAMEETATIGSHKFMREPKRRKK